MSNLFDLNGRVAIVTGGGRGIGREVARTLAKAGAQVAIAEIDPENAADAANEVGSLGHESLAMSIDVRDSAAVEALMQQVEAQWGRIDILVNCAGISHGGPSPAEKMSDEEWLNVVNVNLNGVFWCCRAAGQRMLAQGAGAIVNIASMSGHIVNKPQEQCGYNAAKAGVIMLTKSLAAEWASRGVRVNCVSPGYIATAMTQGSRDTPERYQTWLDMTPMGRVGEPVDIAHAVWYLASDAAQFATGTDLIVDGGYTSW